MRNTVSLVMFELERGVPASDAINVTMITSYNGGLLVNYTHSHKKDVEHRTAFFQLVSINTDNDSVFKKWDFIC